jgi:hypothetical protein
MLGATPEELMAHNSAKATSDFNPDCLIAWKAKDGSVHSAGPFRRERAETLVEAYGQIYPDETYWVQSLPPELEEMPLGRVGRPRRRTRGDEGH